MKIIAVANQKGGVGKTTTVINISVGLAEKGKKILVIDLDPQNHLSRFMGYKTDGKATVSELIHHMLSGAVSILGMDSDSTSVLKRIFNNDYFSTYDYIILDCSPSLDLIVTNALTACDKLLIPLQSELWAFEGVDQMLNIFARIKGNKIQQHLLGILLTMYRKNTSMSKSVLQAAKDSYGEYVFNSPISLRAEVSNSAALKSVPISNAKSDVGKEYMQVVNYILRME